MDAARFAAQSDPDRNQHFRRRWAEPSQPPSPAQMDREADAELAAGHRLRAEWLSRRAAAMRENAR